MRRPADRLAEAGLLRGSAREAADTIYAIASETTFLRAGLPADRYARWLAETLGAALLRESH